MKKILIGINLALLIILAFGCNSKDNEEEVIAYDTFGNELLDEIKVMQNGDAPWLIFDIIRVDIHKVSDPVIKQEILDIGNATVPKIVETKTEDELRAIFYSEFNQIPSNYTYHEYFTEAAEKILLEILNPTYAFLKNKGYGQQYHESYRAKNGTCALSNSLQFYNYPGGLDLPRSFLYFYAIIVHNQNSVVHRYTIGKFWNPVFLYIFHPEAFSHTQSSGCGSSSAKNRLFSTNSQYPE